MAQASGYLLLALNDFSRMPFFASAKEVNFRAFVTPGTMLKVDAERILATRSVPDTDPFSYTAEGRPWINHMWATQLLLWADPPRQRLWPPHLRHSRSAAWSPG
ncbi:MAG: hypothetical protein HC937_03755 [Aquincola sp.]|nr:hypothetical protein [Aquincola sp.]